ncbi:nuclear transport factor 2 family protein, partial [Nocardia amamiensis]|uniref:nuclear transport factor 2 family protein n=1 Tax=Nocardia amamiensis TaxID=404578 RepID=UPI0008295C66
MTTDNSSTTSAAEFVDFIATGWAMGGKDQEGFFSHFGQRMHPAATIIQPMAAPAHGPNVLRQLFSPLFSAIPDLYGEVVRWGTTTDGVMIELTLRGTLRGRPLEWQVVDRIILEDGLLREERSYFDPLPLVKLLAFHPRASLRLLFARSRK